MKKRILVVLPCITQANGVSSYALNYYKKLDDSLIYMDFLVMKRSDKKCYESFLKNGNRIYELVKEKETVGAYIKRIDEFFKENASNYDIIHCHVYNSGAFVLHSAKKYGIKNRILHSHATISSDVLSHRIVNSFLIPISRMYATDYFACSNLAGKFLFGKKRFKVINNAIEIENYTFNKEIRDEVRKELGLENCFVIGNVGRLCNQKNQQFLLEIFIKVKEKAKNAKLLIIGDGDLENDLKNFVKEKRIEESVAFLGSRKDVAKLYNAMDVFCLTSLYEGLPVVGIEAQSNGVPCVFSNTITNEVKITSNVDFLSLKENIDNWADTILKYKNNADRGSKKIKIPKEYDIDSASIELQNIYLEIARNERK